MSRFFEESVKAECDIEPVHLLQGRPVNPDEDAYYDLPVRSEEVASL